MALSWLRGVIARLRGGNKHTPLAKRSRSENPAVTCSLRETAELMGVHPATVYRLVARQLLAPVPGLRHLRFTHEEIHRFLNGGNHGR